MVWEGFPEEELLEAPLGGGGASQGARGEGLLKEGDVGEALGAQTPRPEETGPRGAGATPQAL